ncbi:MAG: twin-arginine translocase subunit TatC [Burkholderiaceae bacterium]|jgi:sec-independent protein translocase protein TatC
MSDPKRIESASADEGESFISHLVELRTRLVRASIAVIGVFVCLMPFSARIYDLLAAPMLHALPAGTRMIATGVVTPFLVPVKVTLLAAFVIALPWVLYQAWAFIAPGLYTSEKRLALPIIVSSFLLFLCGIAFSYFVVFGTVFRVINEFAPKSVSVAPDIDSYLSFVMTMFLAFGVTFEVPVVIVVLVRFGVITVAQLKQIRPYMIVGAFIVAAVVTPPDAMSMMLLAVPLIVLYEAGILAAGFVSARGAVDPDAATTKSASS